MCRTFRDIQPKTGAQLHEFGGIGSRGGTQGQRHRLDVIAEEQAHLCEPRPSPVHESRDDLRRRAEKDVDLVA